MNPTNGFFPVCGKGKRVCVCFSRRRRREVLQSLLRSFAGASAAAAASHGVQRPLFFLPGIPEMEHTRHTPPPAAPNVADMGKDVRGFCQRRTLLRCVLGDEFLHHHENSRLKMASSVCRVATDLADGDSPRLLAR